MSRSPASDPVADGRGRRGQVEPVAALAAVLVVGIALSMYAGAVPAADQSADGTAAVTLTRAYGTVTDAGVVVPSRLPAATGSAPPGYEVNVTLSSEAGTRNAGPAPPPTAASATRRVSVRVGPGTVRPGHLIVEVWS